MDAARMLAARKQKRTQNGPGNVKIFARVCVKGYARVARSRAAYGFATDESCSGFRESAIISTLDFSVCVCVYAFAQRYVR